MEFRFYRFFIQRSHPLPQHRAIGGEENVGRPAKHGEVFDDGVGVGIIPIDVNEIYSVLVVVLETAHGRHIRLSGRSPVGVDVDELDVPGFGDDGDVLFGVQAPFVAAGEGVGKARACAVGGNGRGGGGGSGRKNGGGGVRVGGDPREGGGLGECGGGDSGLGGEGFRDRRISRGGHIRRGTGADQDQAQKQREKEGTFHPLADFASTFLMV